MMNRPDLRAVVGLGGCDMVEGMQRMNQVTVAGVDCGTNSIRLLVAQVDGRSMRPVTPRLMRVIRLGQGVDSTHRFSEEALDRAYQAAGKFARVLEEHPVDGIRFVATSATRDASNREEFEEGIDRILGVRPEVISGREEAALSFLGAVSVLESSGQVLPPAPYMVVDLGGGSTELVLGGDGRQAPVDRAQTAYSMDIGSVRMTERHLLSDPPTGQEVDRALKDVDDHIDQAFSRLPISQVRTLIGVSGTVTTMSSLAMGATEYDPSGADGHLIAVDKVKQEDDRVLHMTRQERSRLKPIHPGRVDVIGGGALIWTRLLERLDQSNPRVLEGNTYIASSHGLLDGIVLDYGRRLLAAA